MSGVGVTIIILVQMRTVSCREVKGLAPQVTQPVCDISGN